MSHHLSSGYCANESSDKERNDNSVRPETDHKKLANEHENVCEQRRPILLTRSVSVTMCDANQRALNGKGRKRIKLPY